MRTLNGINSGKNRLFNVVGVVGIWLLTTGACWAQWGNAYGNQFGNEDNPFEPSRGHLFGARLLTLLICAAVGFGIGAFFSPLLRPFRKLVFLGLAAFVLLFSLFGPFPAADVVNKLAGFVVFIVGFVFGIKLGFKALLNAAGKRPRPTSLGSAKWATYDYLAKLEAEGLRLFTGKGFFLGAFADSEINRKSQLHYNGKRHLLTVAPTRSGKGVSSIIPNLLTHAGSALVVDPKGENALITALHRGEGISGAGGLNQQVILLDPWDITAERLGMDVGHFNPLEWIIADDPDATENAFLVADALVVSEVKGGEAQFWDEEAKALLAGIILYVATAEEEAENRHLGRVRDILTMGSEDMADVLAKMREYRNPMVSSTATRTSAKNPELLSNVLASAQAHTHFLESPRIRASLEKSDFKFEDLKSKVITVYLILPADRLQTFNRWLRLLIQQAITVNARNVGVTPEKPILFMLDEMPTLGRLPSIEQAYGLMAGFGMQLWGIVQDLSQLARIYGETGWQTFISNSGVIQYFGSRDKMTAEYFSTLCGVTTVEIHNFSWAVGKAWSVARSVATGGNGSSSTTTTSSDSWTRTNGLSEAQRHLAYPDELMVLKGDQQIVFVENLDPIPAEKVIWYEDSVLRRLGVNLNDPAVAASLRGKETAA